MRAKLRKSKLFTFDFGSAHDCQQPASITTKKRWSASLKKISSEGFRDVSQSDGIQGVAGEGAERSSARALLLRCAAAQVSLA